MASTQTYLDRNKKVVCYLSAEFLLGPHLGNNLVNLGIEQATRTAMAGLGQDLDTILEQEEEPGLGNGDLGRLAACYLDSLATLERPAIGYGIRYEFGIFDQEIRDGWQAEVTDKWLRYGNPWEVAKPAIAYCVNWGGHTESYPDEAGCQRSSRSGEGPATGTSSRETQAGRSSVRSSRRQASLKSLRGSSARASTVRRISSGDRLGPKKRSTIRVTVPSAATSTSSEQRSRIRLTTE
jgi:glucan phosphorylase